MAVLICWYEKLTNFKVILHHQYTFIQKFNKTLFFIQYLLIRYYNILIQRKKNSIKILYTTNTLYNFHLTKPINNQIQPITKIGHHYPINHKHAHIKINTSYSRFQSNTFSAVRTLCRFNLYLMKTSLSRSVVKGASINALTPVSSLRVNWKRCCAKA